jgi:hypothetical protein
MEDTLRLKADQIEQLTKEKAKFSHSCSPYAEF